MQAKVSQASFQLAEHAYISHIHGSNKITCYTFFLLKEMWGWKQTVNINSKNTFMLNIQIKLHN